MKKRIKKGSEFGNYKVIGEAPPRLVQAKVRTFYCRCSCGKVCRITYGNLISGNSTQCRECSDNNRRKK